MVGGVWVGGARRGRGLEGNSVQWGGGVLKGGVAEGAGLEWAWLLLDGVGVALRSP